MPTDLRLLTVDEAGFRYLRESIEDLVLTVRKQERDILELRRRLANSIREKSFLGRVLADIPAATDAGDNWTPGEGQVVAYTVTSGLDMPTYIPLSGSRGPLDVLNFTCDPIYTDTFPVRINRLDDTGQLAILEHPADQYVGEALEDIVEGDTGDFEIIAPDGNPRTKEDVFATFDVLKGDLLPIFRLSPHDCRWSTLPFPDSGGVGILETDAPAGTLACAGGPTVLDVEELDDVGCYVPSLLPDLTPRKIVVWNQCDRIDAGTRVQFKRGRGGFLIDVECCPEGGPSPGPGNPPITRLGPIGIPMSFRAG